MTTAAASRGITGTTTCGKAETFVRSIWESGFGQPLDAGELASHPAERIVAFTALWWERLASLAVTEGSYGGYMTYVLTTRDERFGAAVALCPMSDFYSAHWGCKIPEFRRRFLGDEPERVGGRYWERSPIRDAARCRTAMLNVVGALDRCAPTVQGEFFQRAVLEHGNVESVLVNYPEEGHGVQNYPAAIDYLARVVSWFEEHLK